MRIRAIAQARLKSERLPGKVLLKIGERTILEHIAARLQTLEGAGVELVFALADEGPAGGGAEGPIALADFLAERSLKSFTGHASNVLKRFVDASADLEPNDYIIRLTADNPFVDKDQLGLLIHRIKTTPVDYAYTADMPLGMGAEVIRIDALRSVWLRDTPLTPGGDAGLKDHHREHVTTYIRENPHLYEIYPLRLDETLSEEAAKRRVHGIRLTIDEEADLIVAQRVFGHFHRLGRPYFGAVDAIQLAKNNPEMLAGNQGVVQKSALSYQKQT
jgi:spore coat polysaccharide biosynthesis protein SpsF